jgi:GNAT superfamily N-acetyltransferase
MTAPELPDIVPARLEDAPALLAMQRIAFEPEAQAGQDRAIPPLLETLDDVREHIRTATVLKAVEGDRLLGAIHGVPNGDTCVIRVLAVAPEAQGRGLGARLLRAIEDAHPQAARFELTTNMIMARNVRFYLGHGYELVEEIQHSPTIRLAFMRKIARR